MDINQLLQKIKDLEEENKRLKEHLKKYTAPTRNKTFYENHKEELKEKAREYRKKTGYKPSKEKRREYARRYYLKKKKATQDVSK
jgi:hypothetical protein